jgi:hypothetical protein
MSVPIDDPSGTKKRRRISRVGLVGLRPTDDRRERAVGVDGEAVEPEARRDDVAQGQRNPPGSKSRASID